MIVYQVRCGRAHEFEAWFLDSATFEKQRQAGDIDCPFCGDTRVTKAPMAPNLAKGPPQGAPLREPKDERIEAFAKQVSASVARLRRHVEQHCDYVGDEFAAEARRIHYGEARERGIYGEASGREVTDLNEEGIEVYRIPPLPRRDD